MKSLSELMSKTDAYERGEITIEQLVDECRVASSKMIESTEIISEPGAPITVIAVNLTPEAKKMLCVGDARLPSYRSENMTDTNSQDAKEIAKLQERKGGTLVGIACTVLVAYAAAILYIALGS